MKRTYLIKYTCYNKWDVVIKEGTMKVHNKMDEIDAQTSLEGYLKSKYSYFHRLVVHKCDEDIISLFNGMFGNFNGDYGF